MVNITVVLFGLFTNFLCSLAIYQNTGSWWLVSLYWLGSALMGQVLISEGIKNAHYLNHYHED